MTLKLGGKSATIVLDDAELDLAAIGQDLGAKGTVCKTVGSAYVGSNPTPATTCENALLAAISRASGAFLLGPGVCHLVAL